MIRALPGFVNFRPIGSSDLQEGYRLELCRSETPEQVTAEEREAAAERIDVVIDLRTDAELRRRPHPLAAAPGYRHLPYHGPEPEPEVETPGRPPELLERYIDGSRCHRRTLQRVFVALATLPPGRVLICCSAGKDRTGVISALLARLRGADDAVIGADYAATGPRMAERFAAELAAAADPDLVRAAQRCEPETATAFVAHIERTYGSVQGYLAWLGLTDPLVAALTSADRSASAPSAAPAPSGALFRDPGR